jgi:hypothetical protein
LKVTKWKTKSNNNKIEAEDPSTQLKSFWLSLQKPGNYISVEVKCTALIRWGVGYLVLEALLGGLR